MRRKTVLPGTLVVLAGVALSAIPAAAHASLIGSTPEDGAVLDEAPDEVVLEFDSDVQPGFSQVAVLDAAESHYEDGEPESAGATITQAVADMPDGDYTISYRVGSADGHPVTGVISFTVESADDGAAADVPATDEATDDPEAGEATAPASSAGGSGDDAPDGDSAVSDGGAGGDDGTPTSSVVVAMASVAVVGIAGVLLLRRRADAANGDAPPDGQ